MNQYLKQLVFTFTFLIILCVIGNVSVDPYDYWGVPHITGFNQHKPSAGRHIIQTKQKQAHRVRPVTVVAGNSRISAGIDADSEYWPEEYRPVYNYGLPGTPPTMLVPELLDLMESHSPEKIYFAVDYLDFRVSEQQHVETFSASVLGTLQNHLTRWTRMLLSMPAILDSIETVYEQYRPLASSWTPTGSNVLAEYHRLVKKEGHRALFDQRERENIRNYIDTSRKLGNIDSNPEFLSLLRLIQACKENNVELTMFTHPYHIDIYLALTSVGHWQEFMNWKTAVTELADKFDIALVDFANAFPESTEAVPITGNTDTEMHFYWEAGHYKFAMGDIMIKDLVRSQHPNRGIVLTTSTISMALETTNNNVERYRMAHPAIANRIVENVEKLRNITTQ